MLYLIIASSFALVLGIVVSFLLEKNEKKQKTKF